MSNSSSGLYKKIKTGLHNAAKSQNPAVRTLSSGLIKTRQKIYHIRMMLTSDAYRADYSMKTKQFEEVHQISQVTKEDRYPEVFAECKEYFQGKKGVRILSFGCCTGEEVVTLRRYLPDAEIVGAEINLHSLKICKNRKTDDKISFIYSNSENIRANGPYDAIFCMAVLQRFPEAVRANKVQDISDLYPFYKFEQQLEELDKYIKEEGILVLAKTHYDLADTSIASKYVPYGNSTVRCYMFNKDGKVRDPEAYPHCIYIKKKA